MHIMNVLIELLVVDIIIGVVRIISNRRTLKEINKVIFELRELI